LCRQSQAEDAFEATIAQPRVSAELIDRFVGRILAWIRKTFGEALVGAIAGALVVKLLPFLASLGRSAASFSSLRRTLAQSSVK
jgi:predicted DNA repair protein MutK